MLSPADNELITRTGPGTPMGELLRRFWLPVALAGEVGPAEAGEGLHQASLIYLGLILFFITFVVLALSKLLLAQLQKNEGTRT